MKCWSRDIIFGMVNLRDIFPREICDFLTHYGAPVEVEPMYGLSHNRIWRVCFPQICVVVKEQAVEAEFYRHIAPNLMDVPIPALIASHADWLILEFIPHSLPRERWLADSDVMAALRVLHHSTATASANWPTLFRPAWNDRMTKTVLKVLPDCELFADTLQALQMQAQSLFQPLCWISGDPNPANWGVRGDGAVILFDWERFGRGTPALDLAITISGMGSPEAFRVVAEQYGGAVQARDIALAKVWNVVEFLANADQMADKTIVPMLVNALPYWLKTITDFVSA